jgi:radical SAM protein with 4Fe4S-binding SPASM domain
MISAMKLKKLIFSKHFTLKKSFNLLVAKIQWKILKNTKVISYPASLTICSGNICNLKCVLCPTGQNDPGREKGLLSLRLFQKIMEECGPYLWELDLFNWGEPLLNPELFEMVRYAKRFKVRVTVSTNLNHFNDFICSDLVTSGLDEVVISLDGSSQKSVAKYQVGNDFNNVIANIKKLAGCRKELNQDTPRITWRFLVNRYNENEIAEAEYLSKAVGVDRLKIDKFRCDMGKELLLDNDQKFNNVGYWLPLNESLPSYNYTKRNRRKRRSCRWLWLQAAINWNGSVSPCCAVWDEKYDFGNIRQDSFKTIWNSTKYQEARKIAAKGIFNSSDNICSICHVNNSVI